MEPQWGLICEALERQHQGNDDVAYHQNGEIGRSVVGTERFGINAFFVRDDLVPEGLSEPTIQSVLSRPSVKRSAARIGAYLEPHRNSLRWVRDPA